MPSIEGKEGEEKIPLREEEDPPPNKQEKPSKKKKKKKKRQGSEADSGEPLLEVADPEQEAKAGEPTNQATSGEDDRGADKRKGEAARGDQEDKRSVADLTAPALAQPQAQEIRDRAPHRGDGSSGCSSCCGAPGRGAVGLGLPQQEDCRSLCCGVGWLGDAALMAQRLCCAPVLSLASTGLAAKILGLRAAALAQDQFQGCPAAIACCPEACCPGLRPGPPEPDPGQLEEARERLHRQRGENEVFCFEDDVAEVTVLGTDSALVDHLPGIPLLHPVVRVHVVDLYTGRYLAKTPPPGKPPGPSQQSGAGPPSGQQTWVVWRDSEARSSLGVPLGGDASHVLPAQTSPCPLKRRLQALHWPPGGGGRLVLDESYSSLLDPRTMLLVELCDFGAPGPLKGGRSGRSFGRAGHSRKGGLSEGGGSGSSGIANEPTKSGVFGGRLAGRMRANGGYVGVAWGFVLPVARGGRPCIGVRFGNTDDPELGATPRDPTADPRHLQAVGLQGKRRLAVPLFMWRELGAVARQQALGRFGGGAAGAVARSALAPASGLVPSVYLQFLLRGRTPYPARLDMTIGPVTRPRPIAETSVDKTTHLEEMERVAGWSPPRPAADQAKQGHLEEPPSPSSSLASSSSNSDAVADQLQAGRATRAHLASYLAWRLRPPGRKCLVPDRLLVRRSVGRGGATCVKYSTSGRFLALAACPASNDEGASGSRYPILIFDLDREDGRAVFRGPELVGHSGVVHSLDWSQDDAFLLSGSSDSTCLVWDMAQFKQRRRKPRAQQYQWEGAGDRGKQQGPQQDPPRSEAAAETAAEAAAEAGGAAGEGSPASRLQRTPSGLSVDSLSQAGSPVQGRHRAQAFASSRAGGLVVTRLAAPGVVYCARFLPEKAGEPKAGSPKGSPSSAESNPLEEEEEAPRCPPLVFGCMDGELRLWDQSDGAASEEAASGGARPIGGFHGPLRPLHQRAVTSLAVDQGQRRFFSGDADGIIWVWVSSHAHASQVAKNLAQAAASGSGLGGGDSARAEVAALVAAPDAYRVDGRPLTHPRLRGRAVTTLALQPSPLAPPLHGFGQRGQVQRRASTRRNLLVAAQGNLVLLFDTGAKSLLVSYEGASIRHSFVRACFSPDGRLVAAGSEEGTVGVWAAEPERRSSKGTSDDRDHRDASALVHSMHKKECALSSGLLSFGAPLLSLSWHPTQHCLALASAGPSYPLLVAVAQATSSDAAGGARGNSRQGGGTPGLEAARLEGADGMGAGSRGGPGEEGRARLRRAQDNAVKREKVRARIADIKQGIASQSLTAALRSPGGGEASLLPPLKEQLEGQLKEQLGATVTDPSSH